MKLFYIGEWATEPTITMEEIRESGDFTNEDIKELNKLGMNEEYTTEDQYTFTRIKELLF